MTVKDSIEKIRNSRLKKRLLTKYESTLNDNTADTAQILADIESWRKRQTVFYFILCFISLGIAPIIYALWASYTSSKPNSAILTHKPTEDIQEALSDLQKSPIEHETHSTLEEKSEHYTQEKSKHSFNLLDTLKNVVERTLSSRILSDEHLIALQRLKTASTKTMMLRAFSRNNLLIPIDTINLEENYTYLPNTLTSINENTALLMGFSEHPGDDNISPHYKVYFFLWNRLTKTLSAHLIGNTRTSPFHSIYHKTIMTQGNTAIVRLGNKVIYFDTTHSTQLNEIRLSERECSFYPAGADSIIEISENGREVFFIPKPAPYQSKRTYINPPLDSIEIPEIEKIAIFVLKDKTITFTTCTYQPELQKIYLGTNTGAIYEIDFDGVNSPTKFSIIPPHNEHIKTSVQKITLSPQHNFLFAHLSNKTIKIIHTPHNNHLLITPQSTDVVINSYENSGFNRDMFIPRFEQDSELGFVNEGRDMLYCDREITLLLPDFETLFDHRNEHENSQQSHP